MPKPRRRCQLALESPLGITSLSVPLLTSKMNPLIGTSGGIQGCDLAFRICS
jgi:hypothetical protein